MNFGDFVQMLAIVLGAAFGFVGILLKRDEGTLKRSDRAALWGISMAGCLALVSLAVDVSTKAAERETKLTAIAEDLSRQGKLLLEVQRGQRTIDHFVLEVQFSVKSSHPVLSQLVARWEAYLAHFKFAGDGKTVVSENGAVTIIRDDDGYITEVAVDSSSSLFPQNQSTELKFLLPLQIHLTVLETSAPAVESIAEDLHYLRLKRYADLQFFLPFSNVNYRSPSKSLKLRKAEPKTIAALKYDRKKGLIVVYGSIGPATAVADTGAIVSLLDLPDRQIVLTGLSHTAVSRIDEISITAQSGSGRFWSGTKAVKPPHLKTFVHGDQIYATYRLTKSDFTGLAASQRSASAPQK